MEYRNVFPKSKTEGSPIPGHLMLFQYGAKTAEKLRFYDRNPLCYIVAVEGNKLEFDKNNLSKCANFRIVDNQLIEV